MAKAKEIIEDAASYREFVDENKRLEKLQAAGTAHAKAQQAGEPDDAADSAPEKVKVGLTISADVVEAVRDYIYVQRKAGNTFKINEVYEAALRSYLSMDEDEQ